MGIPWKLWHPLTGLLVLGVLLGSCAPAAQPTPAPSKTPEVVAPSPIPARPTPVTTPSGEQPRYGGILKSNNLEDPPHLEFTQVKSAYALQPLNSIYSMLVQNDPQDETKIIPDLAERWEVSPDGKVYTFYLRKEVRFHDGQGLTSADVKVSIERFAWPPKGVISQMQGLFQGLDRIETPDPQTVVFVLKRPQASFLTIIAMPFFIVYPKHILDAKGDMKKDAVGTGPFKLKEYTRGVSFEQVRNPDYFVPGR
ncbi:MAG: ABC transporter substrate-binding protein, partial [Chloroflexota bacterium]|nr:ABC transporter substrate-binding protein [Chloroflexota bacterium]